MVGKGKSFPALVGCLSKEIGAKMPLLLRVSVWVKTTKCSYLKLAISTKLKARSQPPW